MQLPIGVRGWVSAPYTYSMTYLNGVYTYTEPFACLDLNQAYVFAAGAALEAAVGQLCSAVTAIPYVGPALAGIIELGFHWYASASLNPDGSLTLLFSYHYCGTKAGGIDLTASPLPGVNGEYWDRLVNSMISGIKGLSSMYRVQSMSDSMQPAIDFAVQGKADEGNAPERKVVMVSV